MEMTLFSILVGSKLLGFIESNFGSPQSGPNIPKDLQEQMVGMQRQCWSSSRNHLRQHHKGSLVVLQ